MWENLPYLIILQDFTNTQEIGHGKTVANATGICEFNKTNFLLVDIPGTYSIMSNSEEEEIARDYICFGNPDATVIILDATSLERNLNLVYQIMEITDKVVVCVNLLDEAKKKGIHIDFKELEKRLGVPVVGTIARRKKTLNKLMEQIEKVCDGKVNLNPKKIVYKPYIENCIEKLEKHVRNILHDDRKNLARWVCLKLIDGNEKIINKIEENFKIDLTNNKELLNIKEEVYSILEFNGIRKENVKDEMISSVVFASENIYKDVVKLENKEYNTRDRKIDKILTSKVWGIPIMLLFLGIIFWLTITVANYPSEWLSNFFGWLQGKIEHVFEIASAPEWLKGVLIDGVYKTLTWIVAVMLPPMAIFFPLFTILEDLGYLPRIAFNLDKFFRKAGSSRKASSYHVHGIWM